MRRRARLPSKYMNELVILGAGTIGRMVCHLMATCGDYTVRIADSAQGAVDVVTRRYPKVRGEVVDFGDGKSLDAFLKGAWGVISCAPYHRSEERRVGRGVCDLWKRR